MRLRLVVGPVVLWDATRSGSVATQRTLTDKKAAVDEVNEASGTLPAGFEFGAYVIKACIGQGGMARVYRAQHRALRKPVALKIMEGPLLQRSEWRQRFVREGQAAAAVKHPNVVDITDVGEWEGRPYLVMELLEGEDLEHYLSRHEALSEAEASRLLIPVIAGLATAHACGVVHRDLKPSNVFLARGPEGEIVPKLLDFGISKWAGSVDIDPASTPHGELMGSPMYMSPEAVRGARDLTPQSDQYSLGVVLYECVTGRAPFEAESLLAVLDAVARGDFEPPRRFRPDLSSTVEEAILRAMNPDPRLRFANVRELGRVLCHAADHRTRLLWQPTFGSSDSLGRTTAVLGSTPLRTAAPLNLPAAVASRGGSRRTWLGLGALGLAALAYWGWGRLQLAPLSVGGNPAAVRALQPPPELPMPAPSQDHAEHPSPNVTEAALLAARPPPRPHVAGVPVASSSTTAVPNRAIPPRAAPRAVPPGAAARSTVAPRATTPRVQREAAPANPVAPARAREPAERAGSGVPEARPALGPNRAPILD
ncbi:MAG: hypothetical protein RL033_7694 [Pseudomonadota bacterium]